jgi:hypothetical protein
LSKISSRPLQLRLSLVTAKPLVKFHFDGTQSQTKKNDFLTSLYHDVPHFDYHATSGNGNPVQYKLSLIKLIVSFTTTLCVSYSNVGADVWNFCTVGNSVFTLTCTLPLAGHSKLP